MDRDDLYGLPLDRFVSERGALARALRAAGHREEAADLARLPKPSVAAWAVNQLVRTQRRAVAELFDAGEELRQAKANILAGRGDARGLRAAAERERTAVDSLVNAARGLLTSDGHGLSAAIIDRVGATLHAAAFDDDARRKVSEGRLEHELHHVGLGVSEGVSAPPERSVAKRETRPAETRGGEQAGPARGKQDDRTRKQRAERERGAEQRAVVQRAELDRARARKAARATESETRRIAERAARSLQIAEERRERAAQALRDADDALAKARAEAEAAADAHSRALDELERI
jgi:hypothetical protein